MAKNWAAYGNVSKKSVPKTKQVTEHRYPVDPQKLAHDTAQLDFETKREKRKGTQLGLETDKIYQNWHTFIWRIIKTFTHRFL